MQLLKIWRKESTKIADHTEEDPWSKRNGENADASLNKTNSKFTSAKILVKLMDESSEGKPSKNQTEDVTSLPSKKKEIQSQGMSIN
jgi:hypothetical protein